MANFRSHLTKIPYGDQALFFTAGYFRALGGFADVPVMEDMEIMRRVKKEETRSFFFSRLSGHRRDAGKKKGSGNARSATGYWPPCMSLVWLRRGWQNFTGFMRRVNFIKRSGK